ncbi:MAG: amidohydrolase family protein [Thermodesulfobacteriota bacterium]
MNRQADLLIRNGRILTRPSSGDLIENGTIVIRKDKIAAVGSAAETADWTAAEVIDAGGGIVMPGLVNTHTHLPMSLFRGLADDLPLMTWLNEHIFPAEASRINPQTVEIGARLSIAEMLLSGTTTCCDGYFHEDIVAAVVQETGIRAVLGHGVIDYPAPGVPDPRENVRRAMDFCDGWQEICPEIRPSVFCHSPYTCSAETLRKAKAAATERGLLFQIHAAETRAEVKQIRAQHGMTPVQYLDGLGLLDPLTLLVHAVWLDERDIGLIALRGATISHNPESNMKLGAGIAPVPAFLNSHIPVGLGTDGCASNNDLDLFGEMDTAAKLHKVNGLDPTLLSAREVLTMATSGGAEAIGLNREIGSLEVGKQADLIVIDTQKPHLVPMYHPVSHLVYAARGSDVRDVFVAGKPLVRNRSLLTIDSADLFRRVSEFVVGQDRVR